MEEKKNEIIKIIINCEDKESIDYLYNYIKDFIEYYQIETCQS